MSARTPESSSGTVSRLPEIRTLVLDDSRFDRKRICRIGGELDLKLSFEEAGSVAALQQCLDRQSFDLFLIDYMLPEVDGLAALEMIRNHRGQGDAVSIMISGQADQRVAVSAMKQGCQDFLVKSDISPELLRSSVLSALNGSRPFARFFDRPRPVLDLDEVRSFLQIAMEDPTIRDLLRKLLEDSLRDAARLVGTGQAPSASAEMLQFLIDFDSAEEFDFRQR